MARLNAFRCLLVGCLFLSLGALPAMAQRKKQIAVLDFDFATVDLGLADRAYGGRQNLARRVADKLVTSLVGLGTCQVIERSQLEKVLREQNLGTDGRIDPSTAAKVGRILGVDALIIGNVSVFDLKGMPDKENDLFWTPKNVKATIAVNFRVIDTTTAVVQISNEQSGASKTPPKAPLGGFLRKGLKDEEVRDVVQQALDETIGKIVIDVEKYLSGELRPVEPTITADKLVTGTIIEANGPSIIITGIRKGGVRMGDRLYVRRGKVRRDPTTNREIRYSEKIGEVEIVEIQEDVVIGSFAGSGAAVVGDAVTNNPTGGAIAPPPSVPTNQSSPAPAAQAARAATAPSVPKQEERAFVVKADLNWNETGIDVKTGAQIEITAMGTIRFSPTRTVDANGLVNGPRAANVPLPSAPLGALLARVRYADGQVSPVQLVGANKTLTFAKGGKLELGINDSSANDNSGIFNTTIRW